jgi:hypothetical protein
VGGGAARQVALSPTGSWDAWGLSATATPQRAGARTGAVTYGAADSGNVNIDSLTVRPHPVG